MTTSTSLVYLIALPLAGAALLLLGGRRTDKWGHLLATAMSASAFGVGMYQLMLMLDRPTEQRPISQKLFEWINVEISKSMQVYCLISFRSVSYF